MLFLANWSCIWTYAFPIWPDKIVELMWWPMHCVNNLSIYLDEQVWITSLIIHDVHQVLMYFFYYFIVPISFHKHKALHGCPLNCFCWTFSLHAMETCFKGLKITQFFLNFCTEINLCTHTSLYNLYIHPSYAFNQRSLHPFARILDHSDSGSGSDDNSSWWMLSIMSAGRASKAKD